MDTESPSSEDPKTPAYNDFLKNARTHLSAVYTDHEIQYPDKLAFTEKEVASEEVASLKQQLQTILTETKNSVHSARLHYCMKWATAAMIGIAYCSAPFVFKTVRQRITLLYHPLAYVLCTLVTCFAGLRFYQHTWGKWSSSVLDKRLDQYLQKYLNVLKQKEKVQPQEEEENNDDDARYDNRSYLLDRLIINPETGYLERNINSQDDDDLSIQIANRFRKEIEWAFTSGMPVYCKIDSLTKEELNKWCDLLNERYNSGALGASIDQNNIILKRHNYISETQKIALDKDLQTTIHTVQKALQQKKSVIIDANKLAHEQEEELLLQLKNLPEYGSTHHLEYQKNSYIKIDPKPKHQKKTSAEYLCNDHHGINTYLCRGPVVLPYYLYKTLVQIHYVSPLFYKKVKVPGEYDDENEAEPSDREAVRIATTKEALTRHEEALTQNYLEKDPNNITVRLYENETSNISKNVTLLEALNRLEKEKKVTLSQRDYFKYYGTLIRHEDKHSLSPYTVATFENTTIVHDKYYKIKWSKNHRDDYIPTITQKKPLPIQS